MQPLCPSRSPCCPTPCVPGTARVLTGCSRIPGRVAIPALHCLSQGYALVTNPWRSRLCLQSCLCPEASCSNRAVLLLSDSVPIWALVDSIDPQPCSIYAESLSPALPPAVAHLCLTPASPQSKALPDPNLSNKRQYPGAASQWPQLYLGGNFLGSIQPGKWSHAHPGGHKEDRGQNP